MTEPTQNKPSIKCNVSLTQNNCFILMHKQNSRREKTAEDKQHWQRAAVSCLVQNANLQLWKWLLCPQMLNGTRAMKAGRIQGSCRAGCFAEKQDHLINAIISLASKQSSQQTHQYLRKVCRQHCISKSCSAAVRGHLPFKDYGLVVRESRGWGTPTYCPTLRTPIDSEVSASALWTCCHRASSSVGVMLQIES